mgnify:CR=1 FL=1
MHAILTPQTQELLHRAILGRHVTSLDIAMEADDEVQDHVIAFTLHLPSGSRVVKSAERVHGLLEGILLMAGEDVRDFSGPDAGVSMKHDDETQEDATAEEESVDTASPSDDVEMSIDQDASQEASEQESSEEEVAEVSEEEFASRLDEYPMSDRYDNPDASGDGMASRHDVTLTSRERAEELVNIQIVGQVDLGYDESRPSVRNAAQRFLTAVIDSYGFHREIFMGPMMRELRPLADSMGHRAERLVNYLERTGMARVEERTGEPHDYSVMILNEENDLVRNLLRELHNIDAPTP